MRFPQWFITIQLARIDGIKTLGDFAEWYRSLREYESEHREELDAYGVD